MPITVFLRALAVVDDGIADPPLKTGEYPISRPLFLFTNGVPPMGSALWRFVTLYLSEKGQAIVSAIGFVPVTNYGAGAAPARGPEPGDGHEYAP